MKIKIYSFVILLLFLFSFCPPSSEAKQITYVHTCSKCGKRLVNKKQIPSSPLAGRFLVRPGGRSFSQQQIFDGPDGSQCDIYGGTTGN